MAGVRMKGPGLAKTVRPIGKPSNVMHDHTVVMRAPRLNNLSGGNTRNYAKQPAVPAQQDPGAGFGQLGMTGET